jgi:hypothetical protein
MTKLRVFVLFLTFLIVGVGGYFVSLLARGYRFDKANYKFSPNGILVAKSNPDGASVYIDGKLEGATNSNLRLAPKFYDIEIKKDGHLPWNKRISIKKEEVTQITAELFKTAPSLSPVTFDGAINPVISPDMTKIAYISDKSLWVLSVSSLPIGFPNEPKKITDNVDEQSTYSFSPNSRQILLETKTASYLLDASNFTHQSEKVNVENTKVKLLKLWNDEQVALNEPKFRLVPSEISDVLKRKSSKFIFSPDENMVLYTASSSARISEGLIPPLPGSSTQKEEREIKEGKTYVYDIKEDKNFLISDNNTPIYWLPSSRHLLNPTEEKIIIMDYDGTNKQTVFSGGYIFPFAFPYVNVSKLLILTNLGSNSSITNLYSLSIK